MFLLSTAVGCLAPFASARPGTNEAALSILGQADFTSATVSALPTARSLYEVDGVAIDPTTGKLFLSDSGNNRILRFSSADAYRTFAAAEAVFGQADFSSDDPNRGGSPSAMSLHAPANLCVDADGTLWVADLLNARVLRYHNASSKPAFGAAADGVLGQPNFTSNDPATNLLSDSGFDAPYGIAVDEAGNLYVSDNGIPRIQRFKNANTLSGDADRTSYLGSLSGVNEFEAGVSNSAFGGALGGIGVDPEGRLWVADTSNHRVLRFDTPTGVGAQADLVLGQVDFDSNAIPAHPTAKSMNSPYNVTVAPDGTLWVSDFENHRVLGFLQAASKGVGSAADLVLGQADFTTDTVSSPSARATISPSQIAIGREGSLFIGEFDLGAHLKRWSDPVTITAPSEIKVKRTTAKISGSSAGATAVSYTIAGQKGSKAAQGSAAQWLVVAKKLKKKKTAVTVTATAFDGRQAEARVLVKAVRKKKKK